MKRRLFSGLLLASCGLFPPRPNASEEPNASGGATNARGGSSGRAGTAGSGAQSGQGTETGGAAGGGGAGNETGGASGEATGGDGGQAGAGGRDDGGTSSGGSAGDGGSAGEGGTIDDGMFQPLPTSPISITPVEAVAMKRGPAPIAFNLADVLWVAPDRAVRHAAVSEAGVSEPVLVGGSTDFSPVALPRSDGLLDLFITADEGGLRTKGWVNGSWSPDNPAIWQQPRLGPVRSQLSGTSWSPDHLDIFGLDPDGVVRHLKWRSVGSWDNVWETLPGVSADGKVSAVALENNAIELFVRQRTDGLLAQGSYVENAGVRGNWVPLAPCRATTPACWCGQVKEAPAVAKLGESDFAITFRAGDDSLWFVRFASGDVACESLGDSSSRPPVLLATRRRLLLFWFDDEGFVRMRTYDPSGRAWARSSVPLHEKLTDLVGANADDEKSYLFGRREDRTVVYRLLSGDR